MLVPFLLRGRGCLRGSEPRLSAPGVARELQEVCDFTRLSRFRHVLQEHMMNDAHRYAYHRSALKDLRKA